MKVKVDPKAYKESKIAPAVIARIANKLELELDPPRAKKKWLQMVDLGGERFAVSCQEKGGLTVITNARYARRMKGQPWKPE